MGGASMQPAGHRVGPLVRGSGVLGIAGVIRIPQDSSRLLRGGFLARRRTVSAFYQLGPTDPSLLPADILTMII